MPCTLERSGLKQMKVIEQKIRSLYHSTVFLWLVSAFIHIFSFFEFASAAILFVFHRVSRPRTQILSLFSLAAILNKFPLSVDKSVTWFLLCARVFSPAAAILESEKTLGTRLDPGLLLQEGWERGISLMTSPLLGFFSMSVNFYLSFNFQSAIYGL